MNTIQVLSTRSLSRRAMLKLMGIGAAGATLAACAPAGPSQAPAGGAPAAEEIELTWLSHIYEPWNNALTAQAEMYMEMEPGTNIVYSYVRHADLNTKIVTSLAAGTPSDIMGVYGPWMPQLVADAWLDDGFGEHATDGVVDLVVGGEVTHAVPLVPWPCGGPRDTRHHRSHWLQSGQAGR